MRNLFLIALLSVVSFGASAQGKSKVTGSVSGKGEPLPYVTVIMLKSSDSTIAQFTTTNNKGEFSISGVESAEYIVQLSFMGYQPFSQKVDLKGDLNMGELVMEEKKFDLDEVTVDEEMIPIRLKGDTLEYNAKAFKVQPNSSVEQLLKRLPGMEVDKDGNIKAQGEQVQRVLVDGKEFFGNDPKLATKNLPADAIDKVQVFDKMSDMADFSGIDDGNRTKTINLTLKEGKKNGYFGKATGGYGVPDDRFEGSFSLNQFNDKTQISAIGMGNNINDAGFSISDYVNFAGGFRNLMQSGLASFNNGSPSFALGGSNNDGVNTTFGGGINFNHEFSKKTKFTSSYFVNYLSNELISESSKSYFNNDRNFDSEESNNNVTTNTNNRFNYRLDHDVSKQQEFKYSGNVSYNDADVTQESIQRSFNADDSVVNSSDLNNVGIGTQLSGENNLTYRQKLAKEGRMVVADVDFDFNKEDKSVFLNGINSFSGEQDTLNQNQLNINNTLKYGGEVRYTEPLGRGRYLEATVMHRETKSVYDKTFIDIDPDTQDEIRNDSLSTGYENTYKYDKGGLNFKLSREKYNITVGVAAQQSALDGQIEGSDTAFTKSFFNVLPVFRMDYRFKNSKRVNFSYSGGVNEPSMQQLQPVVDNSNPLQISVGNPDLTAEYSHTANMRYIYFSQFSFTSFFANLRGTYTKDKISNSIAVDENFRQVIRPVNVENDYNLTGNVSFSSPVRKLKVTPSLGLTSTYNKGISVVNGIDNLTDRYVNTITASLSNRQKDNIDVTVGTRLSSNQTIYSESNRADQDFVTSNYYTDFTWFITEGLNFTTSFDYTIYTGSGLVGTEAVPLWNAEISQIVFKSQKGQVKFKVYDILGQNRAFQQSSTFNYVQESTTNILDRYFMLSFTYSLSGFKSKGNSMFRFMGSGRR